ncbi:NmrA family NAD(P)-binding protein [Spelaeicoccus albus]|uniref:NmrA family NAD(P)-binding protein n=1 Tax=Spelaeicoccus albus TaxID=1280376 RepID=UPI001F2215B9|nr:NmrA family NAD(P)-binding protein [Spelaeicoccus albus]
MTQTYYLFCSLIAAGLRPRILTIGDEFFKDNQQRRNDTPPLATLGSTGRPGYAVVLALLEKNAQVRALVGDPTSHPARQLSGSAERQADTPVTASVDADDLRRNIAIRRPNSDDALPHGDNRFQAAIPCPT